MTETATPRVLYTPRLALPYPVGTDPADIPTDILALAAKLDTTVCVTGQGTAANEPSGYTPGLIWWSTDKRQAFYDTGNEWVPIGPYSIQGAAANRPVTSHQGAQYVSTDTGHVDYFNGMGWIRIGGWRHWVAVGNNAGDGGSGNPFDWSMAASPIIPLPVAGAWYRVRANFSLAMNRLSDTNPAWVAAGLAWNVTPAVQLPGTYRQAYLEHGTQTPVMLEAVVQVTTAGWAVGIVFCPIMDQTIAYLRNSNDINPVVVVEEVAAPTTSFEMEAAPAEAYEPQWYAVPEIAPPPDRPGQRPQ